MKPPPPSPRPASRLQEVWLGLALLVAVLVAYGPALRGGFVWDDQAYVTGPSLRSLSGLWRIWFEVGATEQYYPALHSAFWLEHRLWGDSALGYHLANVFLHAGAACLFALVLRKLAVPGAWFGAFLFALHPVAVESVAWISEQKNTLSLVFYLLAARAYLEWRGSEVGTGGRWSALSPTRWFGRGVEQARWGQRAPPAYLYALATVFFVLAILSKSVTATLPAALLVVAWWQRGRLSWRRDVVPLLPWFVLGAAVGLFTAWVERRYVGAAGVGFALTLAQRSLVAGRAVWFYLGKLVWPAHLSFIYPHWTPDPKQWWQDLFPLGVAALAAGLWRLRRRSRAPLAIFLLFVGSLFPTLGFFNVYAFVFSYVTDHWQYLPSLGIWAGAAAAWGWWSARPGSALASRVAAAVLLGGLGVLTWRQARMYRGAETFYRTALAQNPRCWMAHNNLGLILAGRGRAAEAETQYRMAMRDAPDYADIHFNLGKLLWQQRRTTEAEAQFRETVTLAPGDAEAHDQLGIALGTEGRMAEAVVEFAAAVRLAPDNAEERDNLGIALGTEGRAAEAAVEFEAAVRLQPGNAKAHQNLGVALQALGREAEARVQFEEAARLGGGR